MKAIMYHYIRDFDNDYPYFNYLDKKSYIKQLNYFDKKYGLMNKCNNLNLSKDIVIPTFDDGFKDHLWAAQELNKKKSIGIFFIPTMPYLKNQILDVHKTHLILGKIDSKTVFEEFLKYVENKKLTNLFNKKEKEKFHFKYKNQKDKNTKKEFKKIINYYGNLDLKKKILNYLYKLFEINLKASDIYLSKKEIKYISNLGMIIGSHSENHILMSRLSQKNQLNEIKRSKKFLESLIKKKINTFCYPYGGKKSYNLITIKILKKLKFDYAFSVEHRDITKKILEKKNLELPRYDCNLF